METNLELIVESREERSPKSLRRSGLVPGIIYGPNRKNPKRVQVPSNVLESALRLGAEHRPLIVRVGKRGKKQLALLKEVQRDLFTQRPIHFDAMEVAADKPIKTEVPIYVHGEDDLRRKALLMQLQMEYLPVEAPLASLPEHIDVDVSHLGAGDNLTVADLQVPEGVEVQADPESVVLSVTQPRTAAAEPEAEAAEGESAEAAPAETE